MELVKYAVLVKVVGCVRGWGHVLHVIVDILSQEGDVCCALLSFRIVSFAAILLFACNALEDITSVTDSV